MTITINTPLFEKIPDELSLNSDDILFISCDIKRIALALKKENLRVDINEFIESLQAQLTAGTIVIPAYTDDLKEGGAFDIVKSKPTTGAISNKVYKRKDFIRTEDALHSVFAWGKYAQEIEKLKDQSTFGENSIFAFLYAKNAKFLFIDVHIVDSFTFVHYVEEKLKVDYRKYRSINYHFINKLNEMKDEKLLFYTKKHGMTNDFTQLNENLINKKIMKTFDFKGVSLHVLNSKESYNEIERSILMKENLYRFSKIKYIKDICRAIVHKGKNLIK